jgi:hypothetical protein
MAGDDASSAEMRRLSANRDADPLALDEDTIERLLTGAIPPTEAPAGYAEVAALLAATVAPPTPEELAGRSEVLAELRAVTRPRRAGVHTRRVARPSRRRWAGLAAAALVGALVTGGVAGAVTGHLPGPVRDAARSILGDGGQAPPASTEAGQPPAPVRRPTGSGGGLPGSHPGVSISRGPGAGPAASPNLEGACQAFLSGKGAEPGGKLDATAFEALARAAGGLDKIPAYCEALQPKDEKAKQPSDSDEPKEPKPSDNGGQGQDSGPPTSTDVGQGQGGVPPTGGPRSESGRDSAA